MRDVFLNCPFDSEYKALRDSLVFVVHDCGFRARSALELSDFGEPRIRKIVRIVRTCRLGIHDISRTEPDPENRLPRFNMPLELGIFLGACWFGSPKQRRKRCLVLDVQPYRYQVFCSDVAGQDVSAHNGRVETLIKVVRNWLASVDRRVLIPSGTAIHTRFQQFRRDLPLFCQSLQQDFHQLTHNDYTSLVVRWLRDNPW